MPLDYGTTGRMRDAIAAMHLHSTGDKVGLVMRWNRRNDMIWTIYSEFKDNPDALNIPPNARARFERRNGDAMEENETFTPAPGPHAQIGCHAEEIMIVNWAHFQAEAVQAVTAAALGVAEPAPWANVPLAREDFQLREVDLVLSKSPCHGPGGSQPLRFGGVDYGTGCAMKLKRFCALADHRHIQWRIFYSALPPEKGTTRFVPRVMPQGLTNKNQKAWRIQDAERTRTLQANFQARSDKPIGWGDQDVRSPFGQKIGRALRGMALLNSTPNISCEPL